MWVCNSSRDALRPCNAILITTPRLLDESPKREEMPIHEQEQPRLEMYQIIVGIGQTLTSKKQNHETHANNPLSVLYVLCVCVCVCVCVLCVCD